MTWSRLCRTRLIPMQQRISTNTNLVAFSRGGEKHTMLSLLPLYASHGYRALDLNFCEMMNPHSSIDEGYIARLAELRDRYGLEYIQAHAPYPRDYRSLAEEGRRASDAEICRAAGYAHSLGIPHIVIHPIRGTVQDNIDYFSRLLGQIDIRIGIENMEREDEIYRVDDLLEIASHLNGRAGIVLDTGHAHMRGLSIPDFIRTAGDMLIGTHIADNDGKEDQHLLPGFGTIDWEAAMAAFRESYGGYLTYECMKFSANLPFSLSGAVIDLSLSIAGDLLGL